VVDAYVRGQNNTRGAVTEVDNRRYGTADIGAADTDERYWRISMAHFNVA